jgi:hypothetical protein
MGAPAGGRRNRIDAKLIAALEQAHVSPEAIARTRARMEKEESGDAEPLTVEPENVEAFRLFRRLQTQWRITGLAAGRAAIFARTGLDYAALPPLATALAIAVDEDLLDRIAILEAETLIIHAERQRQALGR